MIYIKDYNSLNSLVNSTQNSNTTANFNLDILIGKPIKIFVNGGGASGKGFTGILVEVLPDRIKIATKLPSPPMHKQNIKNHSSKNKSCNTKYDEFGTYSVIMLEHITAIAYNYV